MIQSTPLVLPTAKPPAEGGPAARYRHVPAEDGERQVAAWLEEHMGLERPPQHEDVAAADVVRWQLETFLYDVGPGQTMHFGHTSQLDLAEYCLDEEALFEGAPFLCYVGCNQAYVVNAFDVRVHVEQAESEAFAAKLFREACEALSPIMPVWEALDAWEFIRQTRWHGYEDEETFLEQHRRMMADDGDRDPDDISLQELREFCESFAPMHWDVAHRLPEVYGEYRLPGELPERHDDERIDALLCAIREMRAAGEALTREAGVDNELLWNSFHYLHNSWSLVLHIEDDDPHRGLTVETFDEQMCHHYECADWPAPLAMARIDPQEEESLQGLAAMLRALREARQAAEALWRLLDPDEWERIEEDAQSGDTAGPSPEDLPDGRERPQVAPELPPMFIGEDGSIGEVCAGAATKAERLAAAGRRRVPFPASTLAAFA